MKKEATTEKKIVDVMEDLKNAMIENIKVDQELVTVKQAKEKARYNLLKAKEAVRAMEAECMN